MNELPKESLLRIKQMRDGARAAKKYVPTVAELTRMFADLIEADMNCRYCGRTMNWSMCDGRSTVVTLQHDRCGTVRLLCMMCNQRHKACPDDSYYEIPIGHKRCGNCGEVLPVTEFGVHRQLPDGIHHICKPCARMRSNSWKKANAEHCRRYLNERRRIHGRKKCK